jgi:hypothetical protein
MAGVNDRPVIPQRDALIKGLGRRFRNAAIPEPGLPNALRGQVASWELAAALPDAIAERAEVMHWPNSALWPRRLVKARKTGALTASEAALTLWLYANQAELRASWALVHAAPQGPGGDVSLAGYNDLLIRIWHGNEERWMDLGCGVCGPFEVRPELLESNAIGPGVDQSPDLPVGRWTVVIADDWVRWELDGPPALELRRWLAPIAPEDTWPALASRIAGPGAELVEAEGVDVLGAPIRIAARRGHGVWTDPLGMPAIPAGGEGWVQWTGIRELVHIGTPGAEASFDMGAFEYRRFNQDGNLVETQAIGDRSIPHKDAVALRAARTPPAAPEPESEEDAGTEPVDEDGKQDGEEPPN